ncbi:MAG: tetratricopeptide repeat protein [Lysobacteraceae bacterium]|nr:MAG: tetratricopeptide repeat protein [Xanthomonadaceae bacterium]
MNHERMDNEELQYIALDAMNNGRHGEAVMLLKTLLDREPEHANARYLLAAEHAQLGMFERAEQGLRAVLAVSPDFGMARFQLGQLLLMRDAGEEAVDALASLAAGEDAMAAYARALCALATDSEATAIRELDAGLRLPQPVPTLAAEMQALREKFAHSARPALHPVESAQAPVGDAMPGARMFIAGYGRGA